MRILVIAACPLPWPRGTPIRIHRMAEALVQRGHEVHVATYPLGDATVDVPYRLHRVGSPQSRLDPGPGPSVRKLFWLDPQLWYAVGQLLGAHAFDVVHAHHYEGLITALAARKRGRNVPIVYDAHTLLATELPHYRAPLPGGTLARIGSALDRSLPPRADHVIAVTERMRNWFRDVAAIPAARLSLIPNGVEYEHFASAPASAAGAGRPGDRVPRIVFAGNMAAYQGIGALLDAFALLRKRAVVARLVLVTGSPPDQWQARIRELGLEHDVQWVSGGFDSLPGDLGDADVLVNPRIDCDGIPQKLLNYMAAGKPIVSFEGSAAVLEHGRTGLVVPDADVDAFADAIALILRTPELGARLGDAARRYVAEAHSWQRVARDVESVYRTILARGAPR